MTMSNYSKGHERDENRLMNKGIGRCFLAILFCWVPIIGLVLSVSGFLRIIVRVTGTHRVKKFFAMLLALVVLVGCIGVLGGEVYFYVRDPSIVQQGINIAWKGLTGQDSFPWIKDQPTVDSEPEDDFSSYGYDAYDEEAYGDQTYDYDEDYDEDFDDSELYDFNEYQLEEDTEADETPDQKALFDEMVSTRKLSGLSVKG